MNIASIKSWISKNATGISAVVATVAGVVAQVVSHDLSTSAGVAMGVGGVTHILVPKNPAAETATAKLATDAYTAIYTRKIAESVPMLMADAIAELQALYPSAPAPTPVTTVTTTVQTAQPAVQTANVTIPATLAPQTVQPVVAPVAAA